MKRTLALAAAILLLAGCSSNASPKPTPTKPKASYSSVVELRDAFVKAGGSCPNWVQADRVKLAAQSGDCSGNVVLSTYLSTDLRDEAVTTLKSFGSGIHLLVGKNWVINTPNPESFTEKLGGTVVTTG